MKQRLKQLLAITLVFSLSPAAAFADESKSGPLIIKKTGAAEAAEADAEEATEEERAVQEEEHSVLARTYPYLRQISENEEPEESEMTLYFVDGGDIPYVALSEYAEFIGDLYADMDMGEIVYEFSEYDDQVYTLSRPDNGSVMYVDAAYDTITFPDLNTFTQAPGVNTLVSVLDLPEPEESLEDMDMEEFLQLMEDFASELEELEGMSEEEQEAYLAGILADGSEETEPNIFASAAASINRHGSEVNIDLGRYMIDAVSKDGECYVPMQTMNDILVNNTYMQYVFNGETVIGCAYGLDLINKMYEASPKEMSEEFGRFNYNELCLLLDYFYGLAPEHSINDFGTMLMDSTGLAEDLAGTDPKKADNALSKLTGTYLDDLHSGFSKPSWYAGEDDDFAQLQRLAHYGPSTLSMMNTMGRFEDARKAVYRAWVPGYEEIGDTAFVTFDEFTVESEDYADYYNLLDPDKPRDTIELISYANREIRREDSPVRNIVIDLSNNGGGAANAALFVIAWYLGQANIAIRDTLTGAQTIAYYNADINLDGTFTTFGENSDTVARDYNLYCLISPNSFSCGNLVPAAFKNSKQVTLIGQSSTGGSCVVLPCTTASGAVFQISGQKQLAIVKNGSFYNIDEGVEPDVVLTDPASFYDREGLVDFIHELK